MNKLNIGLVEDDHFDSESIREVILRVFPTATITVFKTAADFLQGIVVFAQRQNPLIIMEHFLPLLDTRDGHESWLQKIETEFPEVTKDWDHQGAGERLVMHMRGKNINTPIIFYTHSQRDWIGKDILADRNVYYCEKKSSSRNLIDLIKEWSLHTA